MTDVSGTCLWVSLPLGGLAGGMTVGGSRGG